MLEVSKQTILGLELLFSKIKYVSRALLIDTFRVVVTFLMNKDYFISTVAQLVVYCGVLYTN